MAPRRVRCRWSLAESIKAVRSGIVDTAHDVRAIQGRTTIPDAEPRASLTSFRRAFFEAHSGPSSVLVDEFHARILKGASYDLKGRATRLSPLLFELVDSHDADARTISQVLLAPAK